MCNNCIHKAVCSIYRATGGVKKCEHFKEERKGEWEKRIVDHEMPYYTVDDCSLCGCSGESWYDYCPNCGADMRGAEDGK